MVQSDVIPLQTVVKDRGGHRWVVSAVMWTGERYYTLIDEHEVVSLMPATEVEAWERD